MRWIIILCLLASCGGYRFTQQENPLSQYGIHSLSIPMFYNYSSMPDVSPDFTRETYRLLTGFSGLKLLSGYSKDSDAVMIGIIRSRERVVDSLRALNPRAAKGQSPNAVGARRNFYVPGSNQMELFLQVIVIKKPTEEEIALLRSGIGDQVKSSSRIIFNERLPVVAQYTRDIMDKPGTDVIATQNSGVQKKTTMTMAENAAISIRDMILYAF